MVYFFFVMIFAVPLAAAIVIYYIVRHRLVIAGNRNPEIIGLLSSLGCFIIVLTIILFILLGDIGLERFSRMI